MAQQQPFAAVTPVSLGEARWTTGFWAARFELCRTQMIPGLERLMAGTNYTHFLRNFEIAAGRAEGRHRGAPFNDGEVYKWLEAASATLAVVPNPALEARLDEIIGLIAAAQRPDGYLHTPVLIRQRQGDPNAAPFQDRHNFEMYNLGHLFSAAAVHYRVTGRTNLLAVAIKAAAFLERTFAGAPPEAARSSVCPSHFMGLVDLYRATGQRRWLALAQTLFAQRSEVTVGGDDNQDRIPFARQTEAVGHAVRANYLYAGAADLFLETGDTNLWQPLEPIWRSVVERKMYVTGGCGALYDGASPYGAKDQQGITRTHQAYGHNYELPNTTAHAETCANIGNVLWNWRMFLATGEARFMDVAELALYNSVLSGVSLDGTNFFYTNPLRVTDPLPTDLRWPRQRVPFLSSFCCPPNLARTIAESAQFAYARSTNTLWVNLYGASQVGADLPGAGRVELTQETEHPWNGRVRIRILAAPAREWALRLRIPGWAKGATARVNHRPVAAGVLSAATYAELRRTWQPGDIVDLDLDMRTELIEANPLVEETLGQVAVKRGPMIYCLESVDLPAGVKPLDVLIPADINLRARYDQHLLGGVTLLEGRAVARPSAGWHGRLYRELQPANPHPVLLRLIPYSVWGNRGPGEMSVWLALASPK